MEPQPVALGVILEHVERGGVSGGDADGHDVHALVRQGGNHVQQEGKGGLGRLRGVGALGDLQVAGHLVEAVRARALGEHDEPSAPQHLARGHAPHHPVVVAGEGEAPERLARNEAGGVVRAGLEREGVGVDDAEGVVVVLVEGGVGDGEEQKKVVAGAGSRFDGKGDGVPDLRQRHGERALQLPGVAIVPTSERGRRRTGNSAAPLQRIESLGRNGPACK